MPVFIHFSHFGMYKRCIFSYISDTNIRQLEIKISLQSQDKIFKAAIDLTNIYHMIDMHNTFLWSFICVCKPIGPVLIKHCQWLKQHAHHICKLYVRHLGASIHKDTLPHHSIYQMWHNVFICIYMSIIVIFVSASKKFTTGNQIANAVA